MLKRPPPAPTTAEDRQPQINKRVRFPEAGQLAEIFLQPVDSGLVVRNNTEYLAEMDKLTLFTRPTQMGKSTLLSLAEMVFDKNESAPPDVAKGVPRNERNAGYVILFDFLAVAVARTHRGWKEDLSRIDGFFFEFIKKSVRRFLRAHEELQPHFEAPAANEPAGHHLHELALAVKTYSKTNKTEEFLVVLVDEFDRPLRETLFLLLADTSGFDKFRVTEYCPHYISFFDSCKVVGQTSAGNKVLVTGVLPIVMDLISEFKPRNLTFNGNMLDSVGLTDADVDHMLQCVHEAEPFYDDAEKLLVRKAIQDHANHLQFLEGSPLYHTRMVNEMMKTILKRDNRNSWLRNLSQLPESVTRESAPSVVYKLLKKSDVCRQVAKDLVVQRDIHGVLNERLNLPDTARADISKDNYLTLLVHLGVVSVHKDPSGRGHIFRTTSRFFRSEYLNAMLGVTLAPLFDLSSVDEIYDRQDLLQEFMETLPNSAMAKMIKWAKASSGNRILELQFQGILLGELHHHFMEDGEAIQPTQEDKLESERRTDIQMRGNSTLLILELKQKPSKSAPPTEFEMRGFHEQLYKYVEEISEKEQQLFVAGFVVVMYANGTKFQIERTTYEEK